MIYYAEEDTNVRELVIYMLHKTGYEARGFADTTSFFEGCRSLPPNLVLIGVEQPHEDGLPILLKLRADATTSDLPIIIVSENPTESEKILSLEGGADDYIIKPFGMMELASRVRALLRRKQLQKQTQTLRADGLMLDIKKNTVMVNDTPVSLTKRECALLHMLMENPGIVLEREYLRKSICGYDRNCSSRSVSALVQLLRKKLGSSGNCIETVRGIGYRFKEE
jgi:two-component system alkaline phosphatase synthesis response regulator PhoP